VPAADPSSCRQSFHGTFNAAATIAILLRNGNPLLNGMTGWTGLAVLALADFILWRWIRVPESETADISVAG
jgi:hypothetical protein